MTRVPNNRLDGAASMRPDLKRLQDTNEVIKILQPAQIQKLEALLTQSTVSKDDLKAAKSILTGARDSLDHNKDNIAQRLGKEAGIDWKPADGWNREMHGDLNAFGASTICLLGSVAILQKQFPKTFMDDLADAALSAGRILASIPVGIAVGLSDRRARRDLNTFKFLG